MQSRLLVLSICAILCAVSARAAEKDCTGIDSLKDKPAIEAGKVVGDEKRVFLVKSEMDDKACPAETAGCRRKAFLVPGNEVLVSRHLGTLVCAIYVNAKGVETDGWLPSASVALATSAAPTLDDWAGTWDRIEAKVTIKLDKGKLAIHGDATYGALDPDRVKRGAVNIGEISGLASPQGDRLSFAMGDNDRTMPVDSSDDSMCKVWMQRAGAYLLVDDNNMCGGNNVSFRGTYARH